LPCRQQRQRGQEPPHNAQPGSGKSRTSGRAAQAVLLFTVAAGKIRAAERSRALTWTSGVSLASAPGAATTKSPCSRSTKRRAFTDRPGRSVQPNRIAACGDFGDSDWLNAAIAVTKIAACPDRAELQPALRFRRAAVGRPICESATERSRWSHRGTMARRGRSD